uniref:Uncharacterized protein n=1 Tax=Hyaloperonospora arabidopsidis (strain Emoy2) TaxID=559515 RepID=M4BLR1_HYAAE
MRKRLRKGPSAFQTDCSLQLQDDNGAGRSQRRNGDHCRGSKLNRWNLQQFEVKRTGRGSVIIGGIGCVVALQSEGTMAAVCPSARVAVAAFGTDWTRYTRLWPGRAQSLHMGETEASRGQF